MNKVKVIFLLVLGMYAVIIAALARIQFFSQDSLYSDDADYIQKRIIPAKRGTIFDRRGEIFAGSSVTYDLEVDPLFFKPEATDLGKISQILEVSPASIEARLKSGSPRWARLAQKVSSEKLLTMRTLSLKGLFWHQQLKRDYPEASLAASLIGFVGKNDAGDPLGYYGLEGYYEAELKGLAGIYLGERDLASRPMFLGTQDQTESQDGRDIYLTIDKSVQQIVKRKALEGMERFQAKEVCIIVADPYRMAILGLSCLPDYDPREFGKYADTYYRTGAISDTYEPGSTFKPMVMAAAIDSGVVKPIDTLPEPDRVQIGEYTISNWDGTSRGNIVVPDILARSSNIGMMQVGAKLGPDRLYTSLLKYGFGSETGIDLQGEVPGTVKPRKDWYPIDFATATFGQGLAVTPLQLLTAFSSLINGGELLRPYVVERISDGTHVNHQREKTVVRRVISEPTSRIMRRMLQYTVDHAEYRWNKPIGYQFGGKTGTAQIAVAGKYDARKTIASFIGFTPVDHPQFIALVLIKEPSTSEWGSETAAPIFFEVAKELISHYSIPPEY